MVIHYKDFRNEFFTDRAIELERVKQAMDSKNHLSN